MDLPRLRTLRELAKRQTMAAVAEALYVSPSAVSQQISQLEEEVGVPLVERRGRGVRLTPAGDKLASHADRIFGIVEEAKTDLAELRKTIAGELRVAAFPSVACSLIPVAMKLLADHHPQLNVVLSAMEPSDGLAALRAWQADIALVDDITVEPTSVEGNIDSHYLCEDRLYAILPLAHPLAHRRAVTIGELAHDRWALDTASNVYSDVIRAKCRAAGFDPVVNGFCNGFEVVIALIEGGCSVSVMPGLRLRSFAKNVAIKRLEPETCRRISAATRKGEARNPAIAAFLETLQAVALHREEAPL